MGAAGVPGLAVALLSPRQAPFDTHGGVAAYAVGLGLAVASAIGGFAVLRRGVSVASHAFVALLLGVFLGRVALVGLFGLALHALAPTHLAIGLLSLAGFHFIFVVLEVALLARTGAAGGGAGRGTPIVGTP